jgi:hypothetical protein
MSKYFKTKLIKFKQGFLPSDFLNLYFNTFLFKMGSKTHQKHSKFDVKPSILTLFNKFLTGFTNFKKFIVIDDQIFVCLYG